MRPPLLPALLSAALSIAPVALPAQAWNSDSALALARRAVARRSAAAGDTGLVDYKARAHGFLFFLGQFGDGLTEPPQLLKADQLELEVYWKAPRLSKQRIVGWRDKAELPTEIRYHQDHLGIVQNNFGPIIRLGDGDEVRDVPHPFGVAGVALYDFALGDTLEISLPERRVHVVALAVRPRDYGAPRIVGTLFVDPAGADLVRMSFSFTPVAYVDPQIEDMSVVLDNALWEGRWWLPYRQEIEIRRRTTWLDMPARGIIRGRWEVDHYVFNLGLVESWFAGREITAVPPAERDAFPWSTSLEDAVRDVTEPVRQQDFERVREEVQRVAGRRALSGLAPHRLGVRRISDLAHANRVEGLALGAGVAWGSGRALASYGFSDHRPKGRLTLTHPRGLELSAYREVRDVSDQPVIAPLVNSITAQELGDDYGDYYLANGVRAAFRSALGARAHWSAELGYEGIHSLTARAEPVTGSLRPNPPLGGGDIRFARITLRGIADEFGTNRQLRGSVAAEAGRMDSTDPYARVSVSGHAVVPLGATRLLARAHAGAATRHLPPHRAFVLGGRATLLGDEFRSWGGRRAALGHLEWRLPVRALSLGVGPFARVPAAVVLAPYVAAGWAGGGIAGAPWVPTPETRITAGLALECFGVLRFEVGAGVQSGRARFSADFTRDFWDIL